MRSVVLKAPLAAGTLCAALLSGCTVGSAPRDYEQLKTRWAALLKVPPMDASAVAVPAGSLTGQACRRFNDGIELLRRAYLLNEVRPYLEAMSEAETYFRGAARRFTQAQESKEYHVGDLPARWAQAERLAQECRALRQPYL